MTDERDDRLRRLMQATGESTKSGAIDIAVKHYLADLRNKEEIADELQTEIVEKLRTPWLPVEQEPRVGAE
jgi:hypothetical protein